MWEKHAIISAFLFEPNRAYSSLTMQLEAVITEVSMVQALIMYERIQDFLPKDVR